MKKALVIPPIEPLNIFEPVLVSEVFVQHDLAGQTKVYLLDTGSGLSLRLEDAVMNLNNVHLN